MAAGLQTIIYHVRDLERAKRLYGAPLEAPSEMDEPYYVV